MKKRKVQKTGGSTYTVSIPKDWARERGLEEGEAVNISEEGNSLRIYVEEKIEKKDEVTLDYEEPLGALLRKIIARYVVGYDEIKIRSDEVIKNRDKIESLAREKMLGLEVISKSSKEIRLQNLLKYSDLPTRKLLFRMDSIIKSVYRDIIDSLENGKRDILKDVMKRENEVDRLYLLGVRQLKSAIRDRRVRDKLQIDSKLLCLGYRLIFKSLERMGDHLKKISSLLLDMEEVPKKGELKEVAEMSLDKYEKIIESLLKYDDDLAEKSIQESKEIDDKFIQMNEKIENEEKYFSAKSIMNSIDRTRKLSRDIAEIVINLSAGEVK